MSRKHVLQLANAKAFWPVIRGCSAVRTVSSIYQHKRPKALKSEDTIVIGLTFDTASTTHITNVRDKYSKPNAYNGSKYQRMAVVGWIPDIHTEHVKKAVSQLANKFAPFTLETCPARYLPGISGKITTRILSSLDLKNLKIGIAEFLLDPEEHDTRACTRRWTNSGIIEYYKMWRLVRRNMSTSAASITLVNGVYVDSPVNSNIKDPKLLARVHTDLLDEYPMGLGELRATGLHVRSGRTPHLQGDLFVDFPFANREIQTAPEVVHSHVSCHSIMTAIWWANSMA
jgi:hypothetical protein